ncbi:hypothetical protein TNIN_318241 [Trichonephila inaurata madagascariensis]|uniref:Uncharacterized protein n=1 Tax=Trichonephila inaurata madagascariensis TaxID=2747483 RepID=A0A8X6XE25_9ARAC|nr:hypothetical protein TNIN_318241 [Trichonephila inaurata madagascariensis]
MLQVSPRVSLRSVSCFGTQADTPSQIKPVVNNCPLGSIADIHLQRQHSQCDTPITSHMFVHLVDGIARDDSVCLAWSLVIPHTLTACMKTGTPFFDRLVRAQFPRKRSPSTDKYAGFSPLSLCQKSDNTTLLLNRRLNRYSSILSQRTAAFGGFIRAFTLSCTCGPHA